MSLAVVLSAKDDFCRLIPPSAVSVKPREAGLTEDRDKPDGGAGGAPPGPADRDSCEGGGVAELARAFGASRVAFDGEAVCARGGGGGVDAAAASGLACVGVSRFGRCSRSAEADIRP